MQQGLNLWKALKLDRSSSFRHVKDSLRARTRRVFTLHFPIQHRINTVLPAFLSADFYSYILLVRRKIEHFTGSPLLSYIETLLYFKSYVCFLSVDVDSASAPLCCQRNPHPRHVGNSPSADMHNFLESGRVESPATYGIL